VIIKYPKLPTGPSAPGAAGVRALQRAGGDWQTKKPGIGITSKQQGQFQKVVVEQDLWVSAGKVERSSLTGLQYITPSWRIEGGVDDVVNRRDVSEFTDLILKSPQPRAVAEVPISYLAAGQIYKLEHVGEFMAGSTTTANLQLKTNYLPFGSGSMVANVLANTLPEYVPGAKVNGQWFGGVTHDSLQTGASMGYYTGFEKGLDSFRVPLPALSTGSLVPMTRRPAIHRLSPNELFGFIPGLESVASDPRGSQFCYSSDNGRTWFYVYSAATILTDRTGYDGMDPLAWDSDAQVFEILGRFMATRMPSGDAIVVVGEGAYSAAVASQVRIYGLGSTTTVLLASAIPIGPDAAYSTVYTMGGHHQGRPFLQFVNEATSTHYLLFVRSNLAGADSVAMPQPSHWTGRARALDEETIQCPMYFEGTAEDKPGYYICLSTDFGATWEKHKLIKEDPVAPAEIDVFGIKANQTLQAFADAFLPRKNGVPSHTYPGAPWIGDASITPPWLE
jgi:hypothetical protein